MSNKKIIFVVFALILLPVVLGATTFFDNPDESFIMGDDIVTPGPITPPVGAGGGGGGGGTVLECVDDLGCSLGEFCFENTCRVDECSSDADCNDTKTCWMNMCVKLFDMKILEVQSPIESGETFDFTYYIKGVAAIHGDVIVRFWLVKDEQVVTEGFDTIYMADFDETTETSKLFLPKSIKDGVYNFYTEVAYDSYYARAGRLIEVGAGGLLGELLDISFKLDSTTVERAEDLSAIINFDSFGDEAARVNLTFRVLDKFGKEVYMSENKIIVATQQFLRWDYVGLDVPDGDYTAILETAYGENVENRFTQEFTVNKRFSITGNIIDDLGEKISQSGFSILIIIGILIVVLIIYWERNEIKKALVKEEKFFKKYKLSIASLALFLVFIGIVYNFYRDSLLKAWEVTIFILKNYYSLVILLVFIIVVIANYKKVKKSLKLSFKIKKRKSIKHKAVIKKKTTRRHKGFFAKLFSRRKKRVVSKKVPAKRKRKRTSHFWRNLFLGKPKKKEEEKEILSQAEESPLELEPTLVKKVSSGPNFFKKLFSREPKEEILYEKEVSPEIEEPSFDLEPTTQRDVKVETPIEQKPSIFEPVKKYLANFFNQLKEDREVAKLERERLRRERLLKEKEEEEQRRQKEESNRLKKMYEKEVEKIKKRQDEADKKAIEIEEEKRRVRQKEKIKKSFTNFFKKIKTNINKWRVERKKIKEERDRDSKLKRKLRIEEERAKKILEEKERKERQKEKAKADKLKLDKKLEEDRKLKIKKIKEKKEKEWEEAKQRKAEDAKRREIKKAKKEQRLIAIKKRKEKIKKLKTSVFEFFSGVKEGLKEKKKKLAEENKKKRALAKAKRLKELAKEKKKLRIEKAREALEEKRKKQKEKERAYEAKIARIKILKLEKIRQQIIKMEDKEKDKISFFDFPHRVRLRNLKLKLKKKKKELLDEKLKSISAEGKEFVSRVDTKPKSGFFNLFGIFKRNKTEKEIRLEKINEIRDRYEREYSGNY